MVTSYGEVRKFVKSTNDVFYSQTRLPTEHGDFDVRIYREGDLEHVAISVGSFDADQPALVRVHSECLTSEVFGSQKCDCKAQLDLALGKIQAEGVGCVVYLRQEGRGIGLGDKIRAYALQEKGADTVDANRMLGLEDDLRTYGVAAKMLSALGIKQVRLMTNNPEKVKGLTDEGIVVTERVNTIAGVNSVNRGYLQTKLERMNHQISESSLKQGTITKKRAI